METRKAKTKAMYKMNLKLFYRNEAASKAENVLISLEVYISSPGTYEKCRLALNFKWSYHLVDKEKIKLLPRDRNDPDVSDYNTMIRDEIGKVNEIWKVYRLSNRFLSIVDLKRELLFIDSSRSVITYFEKRRKELYRLKEISYQTYKNYGTTIVRMKEFHPAVRFKSIDIHWMGKFKAFLKNVGNAHNTIWTRMNDPEAELSGYLMAKNLTSTDSFAIAYI